MTLRLMTWNIRNGGGDRLPAITEVIAGQRPDILFLQELRGFNRRMPEFAAAVGMTPHLARSALGQPVAVLIRPPLRFLRRTSVTWRLHHAAAVARIALPDDFPTSAASGGAPSAASGSTSSVPPAAVPLTVISTHLNPHNPHRRAREARWLAARYFADRTVIAGDLNGLDPHTDHTDTLAGMASLYRTRHLLRDGGADTRAIAAFEAAGFTDLARTAGTGDLRSVPTLGLVGKEFGPTRLDYLFAGPALAPLAGNLHVVRGGAADSASDHYPVRVDLDL